MVLPHFLFEFGASSAKAASLLKETTAFTILRLLPLHQNSKSLAAKNCGLWLLPSMLASEQRLGNLAHDPQRRLLASPEYALSMPSPEYAHQSGPKSLATVSGLPDSLAIHRQGMECKAFHRAGSKKALGQRCEICSVWLPYQGSPSGDLTCQWPSAGSSEKLLSLK